MIHIPKVLLVPQKETNDVFKNYKLNPYTRIFKYTIKLSSE